MSDESRTRFALKELLMPLAIVGAGYLLSASSREAERSKLSQDLIMALSDKQEDRAKTIALYQLLLHHDPEAAAPLMTWMAGLSLDHTAELVAQGRTAEAQSFDKRLQSESPSLYKVAALSSAPEALFNRSAQAVADQAHQIQEAKKDPDKAPEVVKQLQSLPTSQAQAAARDIQAAVQAPVPGEDDASRRTRILDAVTRHAVQNPKFVIPKSAYAK